MEPWKMPQKMHSKFCVIHILLLSRFSHVRLCATPQTAAPQAPSSLGFSRQEHWSGLPFPSPMHEVKSESEVAQSYPTLSDPMDCSLLRPWDFPDKSTGAGCHCLLCSLILIYIKTLLVHSSFFYENWYLGISELHNSRSFVYLCEKRTLLKPAGSLN